MKFPSRPPRIITTDRRWEIIPQVEVFRVTVLDPITQEQAEQVKSKGRLIRILWCAKTYDQLIARLEEFERQGHPSDRLQLVYAANDTINAIFAGKFDVIPLNEE